MKRNFYSFRLILQALSSSSEVVWHGLLPPEQVTLFGPLLKSWPVTMVAPKSSWAMLTATARLTWLM